MAEDERATTLADNSNDRPPTAVCLDVLTENDSAAHPIATSSRTPGGAAEVAVEPRRSSSPSPSIQTTAPLPRRNTTAPSPTSSSPISVPRSGGSIPLRPPSLALAELAGETSADPSATESVLPESAARHEGRHSVARTGGASSEVPRSRPRVRAPANSLPEAFPPPSRGGAGGDEDEDGSSTSSQGSPEGNRSRVTVGLGAPELDVGPSGEHELELTVPSHQEHLTSDGQRYTTYEVVVRMGERQWSVRKRYSQFDQFRMSLRKQHKEVGSFRFPNKSKFNTFSEHTKERRRTGFDEFLRLVAGLHPRPQEVDVFLAMDEHGAGVRGRSGSRQLAWTSTNVSPANTPTGPVLGRVWAETGRVEGGRRMAKGSRAGRPPKGGASQQRVPRFPPLADQGRSEKAAEAAAAAAAAAAVAAAASPRRGLSEVVHQADLMLRRLLGPDLLSMLCVVAVSAVSIVGVWKVGGRPGIATLVMGVCVGLFVQNWDRGLDFINVALELVGMGPESAPLSPPRRLRAGSYASSQSDRQRAESAAGYFGHSRPVQTSREERRQ